MSIVLGIIQGFIGKWGMNIVDFYLKNSLWINGPLLLYALVISIAWKNYQTVKTYLVGSITRQLESNVKSWSKTEITKNMKLVQIPWESTPKQIRIPLLAKSGSLKPIIASKEEIEKLFPLDVLINLIRDTNTKLEV
jgi:hypothetical protein